MTTLAVSPAREGRVGSVLVPKSGVLGMVARSPICALAPDKATNRRVGWNFGGQAVRSDRTLPAKFGLGSVLVPSILRSGYAMKQDGHREQCTGSSPLVRRYSFQAGCRYE